MTTKRKLRALEKVFAAEVDGQLPFQSRAKVFEDLCEEGLLEPMTRSFGTGRLAITAVGYQLSRNLQAWSKWCEQNIADEELEQEANP